MAEKEGTSAPNALSALQAASKGLYWPSEADKPVKAFEWKGEGAKADEASLRTNAKLADGAAVKPLTLDALFAPVMAQQAWFGDEEKKTAEQLQTLHETLNLHLTDVSAFRVEGNHDDQSLVNVFVVGQTTEGNIAGVSTQLVET